MTESNNVFQKLIESYPGEIDLTNKKHSKIILQTVEFIIDEGYNVSEIEEFEEHFIDKGEDSLIFLLLAFKIAKSKILASEVTGSLFISVTFAVYKEHNRILDSGKHPHGEDFLLRKVKQLQWLFDDHPNIDWEMIIVDDGCPEKSGRIAQNIIDEHDLNDRVRVLFLSDAIDQNLPTAKGLYSTDESQKGGAVVYGMWDAVQQNERENQIVIYTDADLSTHLGQIMLLAEPLLEQNKWVAIGSRRRPESVVIKKGSRNNRGKLFIYLWKRLITNLGDVIDTQCGFKAFRADMIPHIIDDLIEKKFAFDIELLLKTEMYQEGAIANVPIAWIDSDDASTTTDLQPYLPMLKSIVKMNRRYLPKDEVSIKFAQFIELLDDTEFEYMLNNIPQNIIQRDPEDFTEYDEVGVADLMRR